MHRNQYSSRRKLYRNNFQNQWQFTVSFLVHWAKSYLHPKGCPGSFPPKADIILIQCMYIPGVCVTKISLNFCYFSSYEENGGFFTALHSIPVQLSYPTTTQHDARHNYEAAEDEKLLDKPSKNPYAIDKAILEEIICSLPGKPIMP